jgi:zinc protease
VTFRIVSIFALGLACANSHDMAFKLTDRTPCAAVVAPAGAVDLGPSPERLVRAPSVVSIPTEKRLKNGVRLLLVERHGIPQVAVAFLLRFDPREALTPIPQLYASTLLQGSELYSTRSLWLFFGLAGVLPASHSRDDTIALNATMLAPHALDIIDRLGATVASPALEPRDVEHGKRALFDARILRQKQPSALAEAEQMLLGETHPHVSRTFAAQTIRALSRDDVAQFQRTYVSAEHLTVVVTGDFQPAAVERVLEARLGKLPRSAVATTQTAQRAPAKAEPTKARIAIVPWRGASQSKITLAFVGPVPRSADDAALRLVKDLLGHSGGRLQRRIREDDGASYGVSTRITRWTSQSMFEISSAVDNRHVVNTLGKLIEEITRLATEPVSEEEFLRAKERILAQATGSGGSPFEADLQCAIQIASQDLPLDDFAKLPARIDAVTVEDVRSAAAKYLRTDRVQIAVAADPNGVEAPLRALGIGEVGFAPAPP